MAVTPARKAPSDVASPDRITTMASAVQDLTTKEKVVFWAPSKKCVMARERIMLGAVTLSEVPAAVTDEESLPILLQVIGWLLPLPHPSSFG